MMYWREELLEDFAYLKMELLEGVLIDLDTPYH